MVQRIRAAAGRISACWQAARRAWSPKCQKCQGALVVTDDGILCDACLEVLSAEIVRARIAELDVQEAIGLARTLAQRAGEKVLARALHEVLLLQLMGALEDFEPQLGAAAAIIHALGCSTEVM